MTKEQYSKYQAAADNFLTLNKVRPGLHAPAKPDSEPFFSWHYCGCCHSSLGGNRETYSFATEGGEIFEEDICSDCVYFLAYGQLDDLTMLEMESK